MQPDQFTAKFVTSGTQSSQVMESFLSEWRWGNVEHIPLTEDNSHSLNVTKKGEKSVLFFVCDAEEKSAALLESLIAQWSDVHVPMIILFGDTVRTKKIRRQFSSIPVIRDENIISIADSLSLKTVIEVWVRSATVPSCIGVDFADYHAWASNGSIFVSAGMDEVNDCELPYRLYQHYPTHHRVNDKDYTVAGVVLVVTGSNQSINLDLFSACGSMLQGCCSDDILQILDVNFHDDEPIGFRLFMALEESREQSGLFLQELIKRANR